MPLGSQFEAIIREAVTSVQPGYGGDLAGPTADSGTCCCRYHIYDILNLMAGVTRGLHALTLVLW